jgi:hypothetical protein
MPLPLRALALALLCAPAAAAAQEPAAWGGGRDPQFSTFSIAAVDPRTGETGVAVTTRVPCVGNGVPWVRAGVGAVATQANTRTDYGQELLEALAGGAAPQEALRRALAADSGAASRQVGVIALDGRSAQHTGGGTTAWAGTAPAGRTSRRGTCWSGRRCSPPSPPASRAARARRATSPTG